MDNALSMAFPRLDANLRRTAIANVPTPVTTHKVDLPSGPRYVIVKHDEVTSDVYGGNKVRKLEYLLRRASDRDAQRIATFGAVGSNHALATAIHATRLGFDCTCFLSHQKATPNIARTLNMHRELGTELVRWGRSIDSLTLFRQYLHRDKSWVIPLGGTCWLGAVGFVNAGLELAEQIRSAEIPCPARIYIACGTTGSAAGLALGLAAARLPATVHAIQVADNPFSSEGKLRKLMAKTQFILNRLDPLFEATGSQERIVWRDEFLAGGYAKIDDATAAAVNTARDSLDLSLETTYTGKAMAAMLHDLRSADYDGDTCLFWNTYNSRELPVTSDRPNAWDVIPEEFARYYASV
jgi:D-cysteine desulfhydrase